MSPIFCNVLEYGFLYSHYFFVGLFKMHAHMHSQAHTQRHDKHSCWKVQFAILLSSQAFVKKQFCFQGCRRNRDRVSCSYATAANVLWGSKESASYGYTWYVIVARERGITEQDVYATPSLCSVLGNTCLKYVYVQNVCTKCKCILQNLSTLQKMWICSVFQDFWIKIIANTCVLYWEWC